MVHVRLERERLLPRVGVYREDPRHGLRVLEGQREVRVVHREHRGGHVTRVAHLTGIESSGKVTAGFILHVNVFTMNIFK